MEKFNFIGAVVVSLSFVATAAQAQTVPAEFPPASYQGTQYVDSRGCAFVRVGDGAATNWVPRVGRNRQPLCNFQATQGTSARAASAGAAAAPNPLAGLPDAAVQEGGQTRTASAASRVLSGVASALAAPTPRATGNAIGAPIRTVASTTSRPRLIRPIATSATPTQPANAPTVAPDLPRMTRAEACRGRSGIQPQFISAQTRQPIDCGPATTATSTPVALAQLASTPVTAPDRRRMTLSQACAEIAATGRAIINAATNQPVRCPDSQVMAQPRVLAGLAAPSGPFAPGGAVAPQTAGAVAQNCDRPGSRYLMGGTGLPVRCGPQAQNPFSGETDYAGQTDRARHVSARAPLFAQNPFTEAPVPASNPRTYRAEPIRPPSGYERVWGDGRLNAQRGLPHQQQAHVYHENVAVTSTRYKAPAAAATPAATSHRFVQVGSFSDLGNAQAAIRNLQKMGMPVSAGRSGSTQVVTLGPFGDAASLHRGLQVAQQAGFSGAYTR